ncbi:MAG: Hsp20/alpha crystallin family protein [Desulfosarcinaceae bacterium]|nr:Hsp20/alpha crystallin family protein [Desulfosarcinaceae bacterium]
MPLVKWDPFRNVATLQERINRLFEDSFPHSQRVEDDMAICAWRPDVDIYEVESGVILKVDLPGVRKEDVSVEVKDNLLTLSGERREDPDIPESRYYRRERTCGSFLRAFTLQAPISPEKIKATFKDGVLKVSLPHPEEDLPRQVKVNID